MRRYLLLSKLIMKKSLFNNYTRLGILIGIFWPMQTANNYIGNFNIIMDYFLYALYTTSTMVHLINAESSVKSFLLTPIREHHFIPIVLLYQFWFWFWYSIQKEAYPIGISGMIVIISVSVLVLFTYFNIALGKKNQYFILKAILKGLVLIALILFQAYLISKGLNIYTTAVIFLFDISASVLLSKINIKRNGWLIYES